MPVKRSHNGPPWVDSTGVPPESSAAGRASRLSCGYHITKVFYRTGTKKDFPMGFPRISCKSGREQKTVDAGLTTKKLRETQVIANGEANMNV